MLIDYVLGQTSIILRVLLLDSSVTTGAGRTGLAYNTSGLIIAAIADNEATTTVYTQAASHIEDITTLGTYAAPSSSCCRFKQVDSTNHPGVYEIQLANARYAVSGAKSLLVSVTVSGIAQSPVVIPLRSVNPYDSVRMGLSALPSAAADAAGGLPISDAGGLDLDTILGRITDARMAVLTDWINGGRLDVILDAIAADVAGLDGAAMRGTDGAALASAWTATRAGYIDLLNTYLDAAITSRSSHSAADVWAVTTRTLSSFGTLVSDITTAVWSAGTRTLSGFGTLIADVWNYATRALTDKAGFTISGTKQTLDALNDVSSSTVRAQADAALAAYDAPTKAELDAAVAPLATSAALAVVDDYIDTEVAAIKAVTDKLDTTMEADSGVYRFTANALEEGPSGTSGGGDATAANQATIIAHLTDIKGTGFSGTTDSLEAIRDRGDSAWITGSGLSGSNSVVINVHDDDGVNIVEAAVEVWDSAGTSFYERKTSDSSGQVLFNMDDGTYTVKIHKAGYSIANQTLVIPDTLNPIYVMTAFVIPVSPDLTKCRVWMKLINTYTSLTATANVPENLTGNNLVMGNYIGVYDTVNNLVYWDLPIGALNSVLKITELGFEIVVPLILDLESSELKDLI